MAHRIQAINDRRPRVEQGTTVQKPELIRALSRSTSLVEGTVDHALKELRDQLIEYLSAGRAVKVDGLGTWTPTIALYGTIGVQYRPDAVISYNLNIPGYFTGKVSNRENIGKTGSELVQQFIELYPDKPVVDE